MLVGRRSSCSFLAMSAALVAIALSMLLSAAPARAYVREGCYWPRVERGQSIPWTNYATGHGSYAFFNARDGWNATPTRVYIHGSGPNIQATNNDFGNTGWDGFTNYSCSNGVFVTPVVVYLNVYYTYNYPDNAIQSVATHEFGHALGLAHSSSCYTLMWYSTDRYFSCGIYTPQQDEINGLNAVYP